MVNSTLHLGAQANRLSARALATAGTAAMWHAAVCDQGIPTVGTGFKPYDQRPKERLP